MPYNLEYFPEFMAKRMNFPVGNKDLEVASWEDICATDQPLIDLDGLRQRQVVHLYADTNGNLST